MTNEFDSITDNINRILVMDSSEINTAHIASIYDCYLIWNRVNFFRNMPDNIFNFSILSDELYWPLIPIVDDMIRVKSLSEQ